MKWLLTAFILIQKEHKKGIWMHYPHSPFWSFLYVYWLNGWKALTLTVRDLCLSQVMKHINNPVFQMILTDLITCSECTFEHFPKSFLSHLSLYFLQAGSWWPTSNPLKGAATFHGRQQIPRVRTGLTFRCGLTSRGENLVQFGLPWLSRGDFGPPILSCCHSGKILELLPFSWDAYRVGFHGMRVWDWTGDLHLSQFRQLFTHYSSHHKAWVAVCCC